MTKGNRAPDHEVGDSLSPDQRLQLWKSRSLHFRLQHRWNVISAFARRQVSWHNAWLGFKYPDQVTWLAVRPPARGMLPVCPAVIAEIDHIDHTMAQHSETTEEPTEMAHAFHDRDDDLQRCRICGGLEGGSLPSRCPGRRMTDEEEFAVRVGHLDYVDNYWVVPPLNGHRMPYSSTAAGALTALTEAPQPGLNGSEPPGSELWERAWFAKCAELSKAANQGCGLVYELFEAWLGASIDEALKQVPAPLQAQAIEIAIRHGYTTPEHRAETERMLRDDNCCTHGLDPRWCPVGCGENQDACEFVASDATAEPTNDDGSTKNV